MWFVVQRFDTGSAGLNAELSLATEGDDFVTGEDPPGDVVMMESVLPGADSATRRVIYSIAFEPGTYILDAGIAGEDTTHVWRAAVIEVVSD